MATNNKNPPNIFFIKEADTLWANSAPTNPPIKKPSTYRLTVETGLLTIYYFSSHHYFTSSLSTPLESPKGINISYYLYFELSRCFQNKCGIAKEHRPPLVRIRCMQWKEYLLAKRMYKGRG